MNQQQEYDELQKAIDDITKNNETVEEPIEMGFGNSVSKLEQNFGNPEVPNTNNLMPPTEQILDQPMGFENKNDQVVGFESKIPEIDSSPETTDTNPSIYEVKKLMLKDLFPLMDKINLPAEQKFKVYKEMIETNGGEELIRPAYESARGILDETKKAEALVFLLDKLA